MRLPAIYRKAKWGINMVLYEYLSPLIRGTPKRLHGLNLIVSTLQCSSQLSRRKISWAEKDFQCDRQLLSRGLLKHLTLLSAFSLDDHLQTLSVVSKPVLVEIKRTSKCFRLETPLAYEIRERHEYMNKYKLWKDIGQFSIKWRKRMSRHMSGEKSSPLITLMGSNAAGQI